METVETQTVEQPKSKPIAELKRAPRPKVSNTSMLLRRSARDFAIEYTTRRSPATSRVRSITITFQDRFHWVGDVMVTADTHVA